ncbi:hypothetical protein PN456_17980 [Nodularia spumigena CS-586/05]|uniref:hypothetical protein n=1 Tax=Nodularia spumigena TaxID=70799 RepID=UPI00232C1DF3|nr:hypothetical protein [Nodularia spumigena]MDB9342145.1 hypothetical protein [Nodularia spumigena CS-588/06]MDB9370811.1 hypothetical protein [Nodularia spumigena CS-586/05]
MYFKFYFFTLEIILSVIGSLNLLIDPFWYIHGNKITKINYAFNERLTKTNLLNNSDTKKYDCLILGSSRTTLLHTTSFKKHKCFNYSFSSGTAEEFTVYAKYARDAGVNPKKVYLGIDGFNFHQKIAYKADVKVAIPNPLYQTYLFSIDAFKLSLMALFKRSKGNRFYDENFQGRVFDHVSKYEPKFSDKKSSEKCDFSRLSDYKQVSKVFPNAEIIGIVSPVSAWKTYNDYYANGLLDCQLKGIYEASKNFDTTYDFSHTSELTTNPTNTYDGNHYYPSIHDQIAKVLEGEQSDDGIIVNHLTLEQYQQIHKIKLKEFLRREGQDHLW